MGIEIDQGRNHATKKSQNRSKYRTKKVGGQNKMGCGCGKKAHRAKPKDKPFTVMGNYSILNAQQITKRLETFKKLYCKACEEKDSCDYTKYKNCRESKGLVL